MATERIRVEISRRVLHIGSTVYPLQNIARVQPQALQFARWPAIRSFLKAVVIWTVLAAVASAAIKAAAGRQTGSITAVNVWTAAAVPVAVSALLLLIRLGRTWRRYYALVIDTAGSARAALVNPDRRVISDLVAKITKAIEKPDDPAAVFAPLTINNYSHVGHNVNVSGSGSIGKVSL